MRRAHVLVVDDKENIVKMLNKILGSEFAVSSADDGTRALGMIASVDFDVIVTDLMMPGADGMTVLREARRQHPDTEVIVMTAFGTVPAAVEAMKEGAYDYVSKPFDPDELMLTVRRAAERRRLKEQARDLQRALDGGQRFASMVSRSPAMRTVLDLMRRAAGSDATVLIAGESGTGKEVVARAIHAESSRGAGRFVAVNCGAIPENLIESELFGHAKGAFTGAAAGRKGFFEEADGGTLFLDELGELPLPMQVKLNRVLQDRIVRRVGETEERAVDVRVIAATHVDLKAACAAGKFREDLYYRVNVFPLSLPPLRERREDIVPLAAFFLERYDRRKQCPDGFSAEALAAMIEHDWPGNVRELENVVQRALAVADGPRIGVAALPEEVAIATVHPAAARHLEQLSYREMLAVSRDRATRDYLHALMKDVGGNVAQAAERADVERESMYRLLKRYGIRSDDFNARG